AQEITGVLASVADQEGIEASESALSVIARAASGSFRDALGTLDQLSAYCENTISLQDALALLGVAEQDLLFELVDVVDERDTKAALLFVENLAQSGTDLNQFLKDLLSHLRDLYVVRHTTEPPDSIVTSEEHLDYLRSQANRVSTVELVAFMDLIGEAQRSIRQGADPRLELELALIKLTRPEADTSPRGILNRLELLEAGADAEPDDARRSGTDTPNSGAETPDKRRRLASVPPSGDAAADVGGGGAEETPAGGDTLGTVTDAGDAARPPARIDPTIDNLRRAWPVILSAVKNHRPSLYAVLTESRPESLEQDTLTLKFPQGADFAAAQAGKQDNLGFLTDALADVTGRRFKVVTTLAGAGAAAEVEEPDEGRARILTKEELLEILKNEFDARPVDDDPAP
ncbi:MAG TPA: hypothetical protein VFE20_07880, partial [Thermoleophilia bacterium]|nr:hypothetical protein [Thermoleophilia bacterium]